MTNCASGDDPTAVMGVRGSEMPAGVNAIFVSSVSIFVFSCVWLWSTFAFSSESEVPVGRIGPAGGFSSPALASLEIAATPARPAAPRSMRRRIDGRSWGSRPRERGAGVGSRELGSVEFMEAGLSLGVSRSMEAEERGRLRGIMGTPRRCNPRSCRRA
jgi:hypothetical protein